MILAVSYYHIIACRSAAGALQVWPRETWGDLPICKQLEDNYATILEERRQRVH